MGAEWDKFKAGAVKASQWGPMKDWYHKAVRQGISDPELIVREVLRVISDRLNSESLDEHRAHWYQEHRKAIEKDPAAALAEAQDALDKNAMSPEARAAAKAERGREFQVASMEGKAITDKQWGLLKELGYQGAIPLDRLAASKLIDDLMTYENRARVNELNALKK